MKYLAYIPTLRQHLNTMVKIYYTSKTKTQTQTISSASARDTRKRHVRYPDRSPSTRDAGPTVIKTEKGIKERK